MKFKLVSVFFILPIVISLSCRNNKYIYLNLENPDGSKLFIKRMDYFKEYLACSCIEYAFQKKGMEIKDDSRAVYYDLSNNDLVIREKGRKLDSIAKMFVDSSIKMKENTQTYENRKAIIFDCLQFTKSKYVNNTIKSILKEQ